MLKAIQNWLGSDSTPRGEAQQAYGSGESLPDRHSAISVTIRELISLKASARDLSLSSTRVKNSSITGVHPSRFRGRGMDYQESRVYQPGDDVRSMDWRVTARAGTPYVKLYEEERERPVMLLVDLNPGMFFASQGAFKSVVAARLTALIAWAGVAKGDRIGGLIFNGEHIEIPPRGSSRGALQLLRQLVNASDPVKGVQASGTHHGNSLDTALDRCRRVTRPGSLIFVLSDFYQVAEETRTRLTRLRQHNDVVAVQIVDPLELNPPPAAVYGISDGHDFGVIDTRQQVQQQDYRAWCSKHHAEVEELMHMNAVPLLRVSTTDDVVMTMRRFLTSARSGKQNRRRVVE